MFSYTHSFLFWLVQSERFSLRLASRICPGRFPSRLPACRQASLAGMTNIMLQSIYINFEIGSSRFKIEAIPGNTIIDEKLQF